MAKIDKKKVIQALQKVYDPEFPILDIYNMGLIYDIETKDNNIYILMTFTSPQCPMGEMIIDMVKNAIYEIYPDANIEVEITFEPLWNPSMIKDENIKKMFEE